MSKKNVPGDIHAHSLPPLKQEDMNFHMLFANNPIPMWLYDIGTLQFLEVNESAIAVYGYSREEFLKMKITDIRPESEVPRLLGDLSLRRPKLQFSGEWQHRHKDGTIKIVEIASHTIRFGGRDTALVISNDITKRKEAEERIKKINEELETLVKERTAELLKANEDLKQEILHQKESERIITRLNRNLEQNNVQLENANTELEAFSYSVSHDLHAPLRVIHGYAKILLDDYSNKLAGEAKNMVGSILTNARQMEQLIDDLLAFSKVAKNELLKAETDLAELAAYCFREITRLSLVSKGTFTVLPMPPALADFNLLKIVYTNLLTNAIKYSRNRLTPVIEAGSLNKNGEVVYYVKDNGNGFDMKHYSRLFNAFQRLHTQEEFEGTGIGLVIVKRIVTRHGGRIWAESAPDQGATFYFTLPSEENT